MLVSFCLSSLGTSSLELKAEVFFIERVSLKDDLSQPRRFGPLSITSRAGLSRASLAVSVRGLSQSPSSICSPGFGCDVVDIAPSPLSLLLDDSFLSSDFSVGAVLSYARQPKHIRKNTGGRDWLRVNLRVREGRAFRGLLWRFSRLRAISSSVGVVRGTPVVGYVASASSAHWSDVIGSSCGLPSEWRVAQGLVYATYLGI